MLNFLFRIEMYSEHNQSAGYQLSTSYYSQLVFIYNTFNTVE